MNRLKKKKTTHFKQQNNLGEELISRNAALEKSRTSRLDSPRDQVRRSRLNDSLHDDLGSHSDLELDECDFPESTPRKKIDFDLPKFDKQVIHMLELDPNEDEESKSKCSFYFLGESFSNNDPITNYSAERMRS